MKLKNKKLFQGKMLNENALKSENKTTICDEMKKSKEIE